MHLRTLFAEGRQRGERLTLEAAGLYLDYSKNRINDETLRLLLDLAEASGLRRRIDAMFSGEKINITEGRAVLHVALRAPARSPHPGGRRGRGAGRARGARPDGRLLRPGAERRLDRLHRPTHPQRGQHRHRRLRPGPGDGLRGAAPLQRPAAHPALRLQRGRHRLRRGDPRPGPGRDAVHRLIQDLHHPGDARQRARGAGVEPARRSETSARWPGTSWRCPPTRRRSRSSGSTPRTCSSSGTGWAAATRSTRPSGCP